MYQCEKMIYLNDINALVITAVLYCHHTNALFLLQSFRKERYWHRKARDLGHLSQNRWILVQIEFICASNFISETLFDHLQMRNSLLVL